MKKIQIFLLSLLTFFIVNMTAFAVVDQTPPANASIGNQATLEYVTGTGQQRTVLSNIVITTINPVYGVDLTPDNTLHGLTDETVYFIHKLTNLGNTDDSFNLSFIDNGDYVDGSITIKTSDPTGMTPVTGPITLRGGETKTIVITAKSSITTGDAGNIIITAASVGGINIEATATNNLIITVGPVINVYKTFDIREGAAGDVIVANFDILNTGGDQGKDFVLTDVLSDKFEYVGDPEISINQSDFVSIQENTPTNGITFTRSGQTLTVSIPAGIVQQSAANDIHAANTKFRFKLKTKDDLLAQVVSNQATFEYDNSAGGDPSGERKTNRILYTILQYADVTFTGQIMETAEQGELVKFINTITNTGNGNDAFDITLLNNEFPSGSQFFLSFDNNGGGFKSKVPLIDTTNTGKVDTGIMKPGEIKNIALWVQLPKESIGADLKISKLGQSNFDIANEMEEPAFDIALDQITTINPAIVDITNNYSLQEKPRNAPGKGHGPEVAPVTEIEIIPGKTGYFNLYVNNLSMYLSDEYTLSVSTDPTFTEEILPEGIDVKFETSGGSELKTTALIKPQESMNIRAVVNVSSTALAGNKSLFFKVKSLTTGSEDIKHDMVKIGILRNLSILPSNRGETYANSGITYYHTITNGGNVKEGSGSDSSTVLIKTTNNISTKFSSIVWLDVDNNGILEKGVDKQISDLATIGGMEPGTSIGIFVEVAASLNAREGQENTTKVKLDVTKGIFNIYHPDVYINDTTSIILDAITIEKLQGTSESTTDFDPSNPANFKKDPQQAGPEEYIYYKLIATNTGTTTVEDVTIEDIIPQYTTLAYGKDSSTPGTNSKPSWRIGTGPMKFADIIPNEGEKGILKANIGSLESGQSAELYFNVKIDGSKIAE